MSDPIPMEPILDTPVAPPFGAGGFVGLTGFRKYKENGANELIFRRETDPRFGSVEEIIITRNEPRRIGNAVPMVKTSITHRITERQIGQSDTLYQTRLIVTVPEGTSVSKLMHVLNVINFVTDADELGGDDTADNQAFLTRGFLPD